MLYDVSLLAHAHTFEVVKTDADLGVYVTSEEARRVHVVPGLVMIPVCLVWLILHLFGLDIPREVQRGNFNTPTWLLILMSYISLSN